VISPYLNLWRHDGTATATLLETAGIGSSVTTALVTTVGRGFDDKSCLFISLTVLGCFLCSLSIVGLTCFRSLDMRLLEGRVTTESLPSLPRSTCLPPRNARLIESTSVSSASFALDKTLHPWTHSERHELRREQVPSSVAGELSLERNQRRRCSILRCIAQSAGSQPTDGACLLPKSGVKFSVFMQICKKSEVLSQNFCSSR
jgi:hypothetical protein